ncbi:MAG: DUF3054 domain-containing protein, partial [Halobacteria archaeon]|nr:DUF3054 domain-containing protein [Halobacteria archaeon]
MSVVKSIGSRVDISSAKLSIVAGDMIAIFLFVFAGELRHGINPIDYPIRFGFNAVQFLIGWLIAAPIVGAYRSDAFDSSVMLIGLTLASWVVAVSIAQLIRWLVERSISPTFVVVTFGFGFLFLL